MEDLKKMITKLETCKIIKAHYNEVILETSINEIIKVTYSHQINLNRKEFPISLLLSVKTNDNAYIMSWGCINNEQVTELLIYFNNAETKYLLESNKNERIEKIKKFLHV